MPDKKFDSQQGKQMHEVDGMYAFRHPTVHDEEHTAHHHSLKKKHVLPHDAETGHGYSEHGDNY